MAHPAWFLALLAVATVPMQPARRLPTHLLNETHRTVIAEAGDRVVVRLSEAGGAPWRAGPLPSAVRPVGPADGIVHDRYRNFAYQLRTAGRVVLVFGRAGAPSRTLRFIVESR